MAISITDFWRLIIESRLLSSEQCQQLAGRFTQSKHAADATPKTLAVWLIGQRALTKYQANILLGGRAGPFQYGDYLVQDRIDSGRLAGVFRAMHVATNHAVLLRFLTGPLTQQTATWTMLSSFLHANLAAIHPNIARWYELVETDTVKYLVVEDLRGESLAERLAAQRAIPPMEALQYGYQAALAVVSMHQLGLAHGDLRPHNLWLDQSGQVKVLRSTTSIPGPIDFTPAEPNASQLKQADYLAPEFLHPGKTPDALTDIYALGCTIYQLLTGTPPFPGGDVAQKMRRHASEPIQTLESRGSPTRVSQLVLYMMAKNPAVRFQQAQMVVDQLTLMLDPQPLPSLAASPSTAAAFEARFSPQTIHSSQLISTGGPTVDAPVGVFSLASAPEAFSKRRNLRTRKKPKAWPILLGIGVVTVALIVGLAYVLNSGISSSIKNIASNQTVQQEAPTEPVVTEPDSKATPNAAPISKAETGKQAAPTESKVIPDDGKSLWASPTSGQPIDFQYLPAGSQFFLFVRPADLLAHSEGGRIRKTLGPAFDDQLQKWQQEVGMEIEEVESIVMALHDDPEVPRPTLVVRLRSADGNEKLWGRWGNPTAKQTGKAKTGEARGWTFLVPDDGAGQIFVMGASEEINDIAERNGVAPPPHRWIDRLRQVADEGRHVTLLFTPHSLQTELLRDGREWSFMADLRRFRSAIEWFLGDEALAALISLHLDEAFYIEMRLTGDIKKDRFLIASELRQRLDAIPDIIESFLVELDPPPYWRAVAFRFPAMIRFLHGQARVGVDGDQPVINAYLPQAAAHNLFFGGAMALASTPGQNVGTGPSKSPSPSVPKTMDELLAYKMKIEIPQQDLVNALVDIQRTVNEEIKGLSPPFKIKMMGNDLKLDGITQNQKIVDFKMEGKPLADILTGIVRKANPDPSVKDPSEPAQKLVWVIGPDPDDKSMQIVLITTRSGADRNGQKLPAPFQPN